MRNTILLIIILSVLTKVSLATNYYVASNGNNNNSGKSPSAPWQTLSKVNASFGIIAPGDSILFRRGDVFYGVLIVGKSGSSGKPIVFADYGSGNKPVITGFIKPGGWTNVSAGIYQTYVPAAKSSLNLVTMSNTPRGKGRYPNINAANGGYLSYESYTGSTSITDNQLTSTTNWTGAEVVVRKKLWVLDRGKISSHSGTKVNFSNTNGSTYDGTNNYGYFFQGDARTLDQQGEWYFNPSTKYLRVHFGSGSPTSVNVKVSTIDTLVRMINRSYITLKSLVFEGANANAIVATSGSYINILNCDISRAGEGAINMAGVSNILIESCTTDYMLSNAIVIQSTSQSNFSIRNCSIKNTGSIPGMGLSNSNSYKAIIAKVGSNLTIEYNRIDTTGYVGIEFQGSNVNVRYNVLNYFAFIKDDGGGIYTYASGTDASPGTTYSNRTISNNIIMNGVGAPNGRSNGNLYVTGIYLDGRTMNVNVLNNSVINMGKNGIHANNPQTINIRGNTVYNALNTMSVSRWSWSSVKNLTIRSNIFYPANETQRAFYYTNNALNQPTATTVPNALKALGNIDSNMYNMINPTGFNFEIYGTEGGAAIPASPFSLEAWQAVSAHDLKGRKPAINPVSYLLGSLVGSNLFTNGSFSSNISGLTLYGTNCSAVWDNTGKISGGSLKVSFSSPTANKYALLHGKIGATSSSKKYVLRFSTYGTTSQGIVRAYIRRTASPYDNLVPVQVKTFGTGRKDHEFVFNAPISTSGGSMVIEIEQNSGTTYIDNVVFSATNATIYDTAGQVRVVYNDSKSVRTISLGATYTSVSGQTYSSVTLQPFTSMILLKAPSLVLARTAAADTLTDSSSVQLYASKDTSLLMAARTVMTAAPKPSADSNQQAARRLTVAPALSLNAWPNPSSSSFTLSISSASEEKVNLVVFSMDGRAVYQASGYAHKPFSFGSNLQPGMYVVKVLQGSSVSSIKVIKTL